MLDAAAPTDDHSIEEGDIGKGGLRQKYKDNIEAIRILKAMDEQGRKATPDERKRLARYVGWGALKGVFDRGSRQWAREYAELRALLTDAEYESARASVLNAHFTSPEVVAAMYSALERLGFAGGRVLEPSVGVGNFFGLMPAKMRKASELHGVELDPLTSRIVAALYPSAKIAQATGFQDYEVPGGYFDLAIGNPPFGNEPIVDGARSVYSGHSIHNYFFAKSIDKLRPGGLLAMVVSHNFMDARQARTRQWIAQQADLVSAVRLPNTAFKGNAGTEVVTDILIFRKREMGQAAGSADWVNTSVQTLTNAKSGAQSEHTVGRYFIANPDKVLGEPSASGSMYRANEYTVSPTGVLKEQLVEWVQSLPQNIYAPVVRNKETQAAQAEIAPGVRVDNYFVANDGRIRQRAPDVAGMAQAVDWVAPNAKAGERMKGMIAIRDALRKQMRLERSSEASSEEIEQARQNLNALYDAFQRSYGYLNDQVNRRLFADDVDAPLVQSLEFDYDRGVGKIAAARDGVPARAPKASKADIFRRRVLFPVNDVVNVTDAQSALLASLNHRGRLDMDYIARIYDKPPQDVLGELGDLAYVDPVSGPVLADEYLSGDVKTKLAEAQEAALDDPTFKRNVDALKKVIPADKRPSEIHASLGAGFVPVEYMVDFVRHVTGAGATLKHLVSTGQWVVSFEGEPDAALNTAQWGTPHVSARQIFEATLAGRGVTVTETVRGPDGGRTTRVLERETEAAREKQAAMKEEWARWLWSDPERASNIASIYNDRHNRIVPRRYDGSHMTLPGMSPAMQLLPHQKNAVWRALQSRQVLLDHVVGAGKTFEIVATLMEMRRLGIASKPLIVVPNHLTLQWRGEFAKLYPAANVLAAAPEDFAKDRREKFFSKVVTGDWDAVIVGHSSLKKIALPESAESMVLNEQVKEISAAIERTKRERGDRNIIRDMENIKKRLEAKLKQKVQSLGERDKVLSFADLGVDALAVDELHEFKNLFYNTTMDRVPGMGNPAGSDKAYDLFVKLRWMFETYGDKAPIIGATGTPVSNSLVEMFNIQRLLQYPRLKAQGLHVFDNWARTFASVESVYEVAPSGTGYRQSTRMGKFKNMPLLMQGGYQVIADTVTLEQLQQQEVARGKSFPVPKLAGGRPTNVVAERSPHVAAFMGMPALAKDEQGRVRFGFNPLAGDTVAVVAESGPDQKPGAWRVEMTPAGEAASRALLGRADTQEDANLMVVEAALSPKIEVAPESILGQFERLSELTRQSDGKINALSLTGLANKAGLDFRMIDPAAPDFAGSKINLAIDRMMAVYQKWSADKGTQLVFCDLSTPKSARDSFASKEHRLYVRKDGELAHRRGTMHTVRGQEQLPFFIVKEGGGFSIYDAASGALIRQGLKDRLQARMQATALLENEAAREKWIQAREVAGEIDQAAIDDYDNTHELDNEGVLSIGLADIAGVSGARDFSVYDDIKAKLIARGIPAQEIAFIHDFDTPAAKDKLFKAVNEGSIRFLLGSTQKMGAGTNVQKRLVGLHHIDAPWRPSDLEQREGRIIRRGNMLYDRDPDGFEVEIFRYATEQTYDTRRWQILEHKARAVAQLRNYDGSLNEIEDIEGEAANASDMKAAASGDPMILEETRLRNEIKRLEALRAAHADTAAALAMQARIKGRYAQEIGPQLLETLQALAESAEAKPAPKEGFAGIGVNGKVISDRAQAVDAIQHSINRVFLSGGVESFVFRGVDFTLERAGGYVVLDTPTGTIYEGRLDGERPPSPSGFITRMGNYVDRLPALVEDVHQRIEQAGHEAKALREQAGKPFESALVLEKAKALHKKVQRALIAKGPSIPQEQKAHLDAALVRQRQWLQENGYAQALAEFGAVAGGEESVMFSRSAGSDAWPKQEGPGVLGRTMDTAGLPNKGRDAVRGFAEHAAQELRRHGFAVTVTHSGSVVGPSSYLDVFDPSVALMQIPQVRVSGHSKGAFNYGAVIDIGGEADLQALIDKLTSERTPERIERARAVAERSRREQAQEQAQFLEQQKIKEANALARADEKLAAGKPLSKTERRAVQAREEGRLIRDGGRPYFSRRYSPSAEDRAEAERQFEETERAYGGRAAYEKAKAAGKTKLSYGQWVQVRTPNFKQWFGDWEGLRAQQRLDEMNPVDIALPDALKSASLAELREAVKARLDALAESGVVAQHPDVGEIGFSKGNNKKVASTSAVPEKLHAAHDIVRVIESAVHVGSALSGDAREALNDVTYHTLAAKVHAAGRDFVAVVTVKQTKDGQRFYNTVAVNSGQEKAPAAYPGVRASEDAGSTTAFTGAGRSVLPSLRRVNPDDVSKATEPETGEPLAAYLDGGHEFEQTARAYGGKAAWEKAKAEGQTKLTYHQWVQVRTPAFKKWWGYDWEQTGQRQGAAKGLQRDDVGGVDRVAAAADAGNGGATGQVWGLDRDTAEPRLWFHGTKDDIAAFDLEHPNRKDKGWLGKGVYVTDSVDLAEIYAHNKRGEDGANVMPLFAAVRNPYVADVGLKKRLRYANAAQVSAFTKALQERGFDGVVVRLAEDAAEMVAFEPTAVKSAIGNSGDFDAQNPDIRYSQSAQARLDALQSLSADGMRQSYAQARASEAAHVAVVERVAQKIVARWANAPRVVVVAGMQDAKVPRVVREHDAVQKSQGAKGEPQGFFYQGQVYLVAGQLKTSRDVARVLMHEALGHYGLRGVFGGSLSSILNRLTLARRAQVVAKAREYGLHGLSKQQAGQASDAQIWQAMTSRQRLEAAEEVLAELAQRQPRLGLVREAVAAIRAWLREHVPALRHWLGEMSDDEIIREFILPARDWVQRGPQAQAAGALPAFQRAWHGSPHRGIEKEGFKLHKMGTGEGAQAYGWGMYFASQREVAEHYRTMNSGEVRIDGQLLWGREGKGPATTGNARADELLRAFDGNLLAAIEDAAFFEEHEAVAALEALVGRVQRTQPGQLYRVEIPEDGDLLDWDKPLSEQPSKVREAVLASPVIGRESDGWRGAPDGMAERSIGARAGKEIYFDLVARFGTDGDAAREASEHLGSLGIPGLRYLDGLSRDGLGGGHNYVIWDEALLTPEAAQIEPMYNRKARFFSALEHAVAGLPMKAGDAAAWRQQIAGLVAKGQVKQDEVFWSGVQDWLDAQSGKIAREAVQHYLKDNHVRFGESSAQWTYTDTAGNKQSFDSEEEARKSYEGELEWIENEAAGVSEGDDSLTLWTNWDDSAAHFDKEESDQWVNEEDDDDVIDSPEENFYISRGGSAEEDGDTLKIYDGDGDLKDVYVRQKKEVWNGYRNGYPEYAWEGIESREEALEILEEEAEKIREGLRDEMSEPEKSGLASTRQLDFSGYSFADKGGNYREVLITASGDRVGSYKSSHWNPSNVITHVRLTDFDDGQTLFVEELQSDWAQDARAGKTEAKAPFVDSTGKWLDLALKRVLIEAVNGGYTRVALIDGQQSVERYSLDKQISRMDYANGELVAHRKDGGRPIRHKVDEKGLASVIGKEAAERLLSASPRDGVQSIEGEDLKMGGEGMRAFYDIIVPRALEKLLKKADKSIRLQARAQGETEQEQLGFEVTDALADKIAAGVPMFSRKSPDDAGSNQVWEDVQKARILQGEPVAVLRGDEAPQTGMADVRRWASNLFASQGGSATNPEIGPVVLDGRAVRDSMAHGKPSPFKYLAFAAVKDVLEKGVLVTQAVHGNVDSFYISAPVKIRGVDDVVTVLVRKDPKDQRMYLHSVATKESLLKRRVSGADANASGHTGSSDSGDPRSIAQNAHKRKATKSLLDLGVSRTDTASGVERSGSTNQEGGATEPPSPKDGKVASDAVAAELRRLLSLDVQGDASGDGLPMFSRSDAAEQTGKVIGSVARTSIMKSASHKLTDWLKVGLQFLGRRHLVEIYGKDLPMAEYERLADWMAADANHVSAAADDLAQRWGKLKDEAALAELMHDATLAQIDADSRVPYAEGDDRVKSRHLKGRFDALSREAQEIYREVRQSYQEHYEQVQQAMKDRILRSAISAPRRARLLQKMDVEFFGKVKGVYFPLARFGQYVVAVRDAAGEVVSVSRAETMAEADAMRQQMRQAWPAQKGFSVGRVTLSKDFVAGRDMVGRGFMSELYGALEKTVPAEQLAELEDTLGQLYLASLPDLSWAKHGIHRKGTPGFSQDARRAFAQNTVHGARYLAKLRYGDRMQEELERMQKHVDERGAADESYDQPRMQRVVDEMSKRHEAMMNPKVSPISTALTSAGFLFYLGLSPASAMVNLTQTPLVAYPIMGGKWGFGKAAAALLRASKEAAANKNDIRQSLGDKQEIAAYEQAVRAGVIDVTMAHDLAGIAQGEDSAVMWKIRPVMRLASFMFHHAERFNRQTTFMAAYRLARQAGAEHDAAYEQAVDVTYRGHFDYSVSNRPRVMQGNVARVVLLFKQFSVNMIFTLARQAYMSVAGESPQVRKEARKVFAALMATHAMAAGVLGLPLVGVLLAMASALGGSDDEPWDAEVAMRNLMAQAFGPKASEVIAKGLSRLTPVDISGRVGLDHLIFPDVQEGLSGQRWAESLTTALLGPVVGIGVNWAKGAQKMADGDYLRALEDFMPVAARSAIKSYRYWDEGAQDRSGISIKDEVGALGLVGQLAGFSPSEVRLAFEGKKAVMDADRKLNVRRSRLLAQFAQAAMHKDTQGMQEARDAIRAFNRVNPGRRITAQHMHQSVQGRRRRVAGADNGVYLPRTRRDAMQAGAFAWEQ